MIIKLVFLRAENLINVVYYILPIFIIALVQKYTKTHTCKIHIS